jgi:hypothetical protein
MKGNYKSIGFGGADAIFLSGIIVTVSALIYMILNLHRADSIIKFWIPFMAIGLSFIFIGIIMRPKSLSRGERKRYKFLRFKH